MALRRTGLASMTQDYEPLQDFTLMQVDWIDVGAEVRVSAMCGITFAVPAC
jgi:hypothetical protein